MTSAVLDRVALRSTSTVSLNERFSHLLEAQRVQPVMVTLDLDRLKQRGLTIAYNHNQNLALLMEDQPSVQAALLEKGTSHVKQRLGRANIWARLGRSLGARPKVRGLRGWPHAFWGRRGWPHAFWGRRRRYGWGAQVRPCRSCTYSSVRALRRRGGTTGLGLHQAWGRTGCPRTRLGQPGTDQTTGRAGANPGARAQPVARGLGASGPGRSGDLSRQAEVITKEELDNQLEEYMSLSKIRLDAQLDEYMAMPGDVWD